MAKTKRRRWTCPICGGGKLAPERMASDDARRYCFGCSDETGRLVRRTCAVLEQRREKAKAKRSAKAKRKRRRDAADPKVVLRRLERQWTRQLRAKGCRASTRIGDITIEGILKRRHEDWPEKQALLLWYVCGRTPGRFADAVEALFPELDQGVSIGWWKLGHELRKLALTCSECGTELTRSQGHYLCGGCGGMFEREDLEIDGPLKPRS